MPIYGVTLDDLTRIDDIVASLTNLPYRPTVRVVFDPGTSADHYYPLLVKLHKVAYVMGEVLDSYYFPTTLQYYTNRTQELVGRLSGVVDVWEIANEINGEWLRPDPKGSDKVVAAEETEIGEMVDAAYVIVHGAGGKTAVTLYYNDDGQGNNCWQNYQDAWQTWPAQFLPGDVLVGADYVLFSYYPYQDCPGLNPVWSADFSRLETTFPNAKVGFGEIGTSSIRAPQSVQDDLITTYYPMADSIDDPRFAGGFFWWYYAEEMIPYDSSHYWQLLDQTIGGLRPPH